MKKAQKSWLDYELLVEAIYRQLDPGALVKHNDQIRGIETESLRQIDVSIRKTVAGHDLLVIVQAKKYARAADANVVGEFASVIRDVRASKGVLICSSGFTQGARNQAEKLGIDLCEAFDVTHHPWRETLTIPVILEQADVAMHCDFSARLEKGDQIPKMFSKVVLSPDGGKSRVDVFGTFVSRWNSGQIPQEEGRTHYIVTDQQLEVLVGPQSKWRPVQKFVLNYVVRKKRFFKHCQPSEYQGLHNLTAGRTDISKLDLTVQVPASREGWQEFDDHESLGLKERDVVLVLGSVTLDPSSAREGEMTIRPLPGG